MKIAKTRHTHVATYKRPSTKALQATTYNKRGEKITVYPSIEGWFEVRQVGTDGERYAEFIRKKDVRYTLKSLAAVFMKRLKLKRRKSK